MQKENFLVMYIFTDHIDIYLIQLSIVFIYLFNYNPLTINARHDRSLCFTVLYQQFYQIVYNQTWHQFSTKC